jgi:glycosyltransferase involved in cell wall biosynthesis
VTHSVEHLPRVTACVPAYNSAKFVAKTLEALQAQDYPNLEVLISDDASSDGTAEICQELAKHCDYFHVTIQQRRLGWIANTNTLLLRATGAYVFILPHDDIPHPIYVSRLVDELEGKPEAILAYADTKVSYSDVDDSSKQTIIASYSGMSSATDKISRARCAARYQRDLLDRRWPNVLTMVFRGLFRREAISMTGGLHRNFSGEFGADWTWLFHLALLGNFIHVPETLIEKRRFSDSLSKTWKYSVYQRIGEWSGCVAAASRADLGWKEATLVYSSLLWEAASTFCHAITIRSLSRSRPVTTKNAEEPL